MIRLARERSSAYDNIDYSVEDVNELSLPAGRYDCIVSLATLHHLPLHDTIIRLRDALAPGGTLLIHDLTADDGIVDLILTAIALPISRARQLWTTGRLRMPREVRDAWREHGDGERYLTMREVSAMARKLLPGAEVHRHLMWRYTVVWRKGVRSQELGARS